MTNFFDDLLIGYQTVKNFGYMRYLVEFVNRYVSCAVFRNMCCEGSVDRNGVGTNFGVGVEEARPERPRAGDGVLE